MLPTRPKVGIRTAPIYFQPDRDELIPALDQSALISEQKRTDTRQSEDSGKFFICQNNESLYSMGKRLITH